MTKFRPCIDLHAGQVKQIVGGTLSEKLSELQTNHVSQHSAGYFAKLYRDNALTGAHVIMLGAGNEEAVKEALDVWPGGLQIGGGITDVNALQWINWGADKVIVTSYLFPDAKFSLDRLHSITKVLGGDSSKLVVDLSCRKQENKWIVAMNKWQTLTDTEVNQSWQYEYHTLLLSPAYPVLDTIKLLEPWCCEFLIHAADNEGLQRGIDEQLVKSLSQWCSIPVTYAGGGRNLEDLDKVKELSEGRVNLTIGSALDIFGGKGVQFEDCIAWNMKQEIGSSRQQWHLDLRSRFYLDSSSRT